MSKSALLLLSNMPPVLTYAGDKVRGAGWYGPTRGLHTVSAKMTNFQGRLFVEASLAMEPTDADWFSVLPEAVPHLQFPTDKVWVGETKTMGWSFKSNCMWIRARVDRSYFLYPQSSEAFIAQHGMVDFVNVIY